MEQSSGRDRLNIHGAVDLETGQTIMKDVLTVDALSTILLLTAVEAMYPGMRWVHVFVDNARYHHAKLVQAWLAQPGRRIKLHFIPAYCPHLNPIERLWGLMHRHTTHNKCYSSFTDFSSAMLHFLRDDVPRNWRTYCDEVTDNFRMDKPNGVPDHRVSGVYHGMCTTGALIARYGTLVDAPDQRLASIRARHVKMTRYFRAIALTASTADLMTMSLRFAAHYERLSKAGMPEPAGGVAPGPPELSDDKPAAVRDRPAR